MRPPRGNRLHTRPQVQNSKASFGVRPVRPVSTVRASQYQLFAPRV